MKVSYALYNQLIACENPIKIGPAIPELVIIS